MNRIILIVTGTILAFIAILALLVLILLDKQPRQFAKSEGDWIKKEEKSLRYIFTNIFLQAKTCANNGTIPTSFQNYKDQCNGKIRSIIDTKFDHLLDECSRFKEKGCVHGRRPPVYFIKLQDDSHIEKLFQDGTYFIENVDTNEEETVVKILQGKKDPFPFPLYNSNPYDIQPYFSMLPARIYLRDFPTEIDYIFPIKDETNKIIGAYVRLYGD